jgi:solute carrier family 25 phosphate transporter 3
MAKFAVQGAAAEKISTSVLGKDVSKLTGSSKLLVSLSSGVIAGVAAAVISHPADTLLSKVNKAGAGGEGSIFTRLGRIASEIGFVKLATVGLGARCVMIGTLTAGQFLLFDIVMDITGAEKFHFHNPADHH